jgi:glycosyltransferase involved in cell wall biosynthesis
MEAAFPGSRVGLIPQGIEGPAAAPPLPKGPIAGIIARMDPVKGHAVLLDAALTLKPQVPGLVVACAGEGPELMRLNWRLKPQGLDGVVRLLGRVPDRWAFIGACRIGVVASIGSEAVSRAALEWMAAGRPLVATRVGGIPDLVAHGTTGLLVPPGDADALAAAVKSLLDDPERAAAMGAAARARWESFFSPGPFFTRTQALYEQALRPVPR